MPLTCILDIESYDHRIVQVGKYLGKSLVQVAAGVALKSEFFAQICSGLLMLHPVKSWKSPLFYSLLGQPAPLLHSPIGDFLFILRNLNVSFSNISPLSLILSPHSYEEPGSISLLTALRAVGGCCCVPPYSHPFWRLNTPWSLSLCSQGKCSSPTEILWYQLITSVH